jgi:MraZ protein
LAFRGHFEYALDGKNRLTVPPKFRPAFAQGVVLHGALEPCVALWTPDGFDAFTSSFLAGLNPLSEERGKLTRYFAGNSFDVELDSAGRVTLNPALLSHAGIEKDVVVVGVLDRVEAWDRRRWSAHQEELRAEVREIARTVGHAS